MSGLVNRLTDQLVNWFPTNNLQSSNSFIFRLKLPLPMNLKLALVFLFLAFAGRLKSQHIQFLTEGNKTSIRGLSVVNDKVVWASGSNGMVGLSVDGGKKWNWTQVDGYEKSDFRDIEAFDEKNAIILGITQPACILKTTDGGRHWKTVYKDTAKAMFLDAMDFNSPKYGVVIGDPVNGRFYMALTHDGGETWLPIDTVPKERPYRWKAQQGEAFFASSGTNIRYIANRKWAMVSGGENIGYYDFKDRYTIPLVKGKETTGPNSIAVAPDGRMVIVGGDFANDTATANNCAVSPKGLPYVWTIPEIPPHGYRSCVESIDNNKFICCGTTGVDVTTDGGIKWQLISRDGFHVCRKAKSGTALFLAGADGRIAKFTW
jgi:hypothetical protein